MLKRTMKCGEARPANVGQEITLNGWVNSTRNHGGILFIDIRDHTGVTQLVFDPDSDKARHEMASSLRREDVIAARGKIAKRQAVNVHIPTGEVEMIVSELEVLNRAERMPILPDENIGDVSEEQRLRYRYVDLRRPRMQEILRTRHKVMQIIRAHMSSQGFIEIETPILCKSTPEGARDFLVPSRLMQRNFYALPQSPQILKQILMMSGCDRYFQIVRCFRDENLRADRQPEFTQLDVEMAFVEQEDVFAAFEGVVKAIWKGILNYEANDIFRLTYADAMNKYGSDKPDLRFGVELIDITDIASNCEFKVFTGAIANGGVVKAICVPGGASLTRKQTDELQEWVKLFGAGGLPLVKVTANGYETGIAKFITGSFADQLKSRMGAKEGDLILFAADKAKVANRVLGQLRVRLGKELKLIDESKWSMFWVVDFPLMEFNDEEHRWEPAHHPFCSPRLDQIHLMETDPGAVIAQTYDFVINGNEMLSGSIRIHRTDVQAKIFKMLNISDEDAKAKFGFLLDALKYGCPPHGGFAMGLDRVIMLLCNTDNIRDVIAFPKTQTGADLMMNCPGEVAKEQLDELGLQLAPMPSKR